MSRNIRIGPDSGTAATQPGVWQHVFTADAAVLGGTPRFVMLHFTGAQLPPGAQVTVTLGYSTDTFTAANGAEFWTRPFNPAANGVGRVRVTAASGGVTLADYASGEPTITGTPGAPYGSRTNPDFFLQTNPYQEPIYETRLKCGSFDWLQAAAASTAAEVAAARATGVIVSIHSHDGGLAVSTCTGTLIGPDLFLTARHCLTETNGSDVLSASVTFDFQTTVTGARPSGYNPVFHKVRRIVRAGASPTTYTIDSDWVVLQIDTPPQGLGIAHRPLRSAAPMTNEPIFAVHHPHGAVKKFARGTLTSGTVKSVTGFDFAGGSSGSALFDANGSIIGATLSQGPISGPCEVGYTPARKVLDTLATPPPPVKPFDIVLVVDRSGSMSSVGFGTTWTKMHHAAESASMFVSLVRQFAGDRIGLVSFSSSASNPADAALTPVNPPSKSMLNGKFGALTPNGSTSIGDGLRIARDMLVGATNDPAILLLTDGLQNTQPWISAIEPTLGDIKIFAIGFGNDADLDGPLLTRLARDHGGIYVRAADGLSLKKYFSLCFGNIFEAGLLADPVSHIASGDYREEVMKVDVCDEEQITVVLGWDDPAGALLPSLIAPDGTIIDLNSYGCEVDRGRTWSYLRVPLPQGSNRTGTWVVVVEREERRGTKPVDLTYFVSVVADGGPRLTPLPPMQPVRVGDDLPIRVGLHYSDGATPHGHVTVRVTMPDGSLGELVAKYGLVGPTTGSDPLSEWHASLAAIAAANGGQLPLGETVKELELFDDGEHDDGAMEPDGVYANVVQGLTTVEGTYTFHAVARYGHECPSTREAMWSIYVHPKVDPEGTEIEVRPRRGDKERKTLRLWPRDVHGNLVGPGRLAVSDVTGALGTVVEHVHDNGDGSYTIGVHVDAAIATTPTLVVTSEGEAPVVLTPRKPAKQSQRSSRRDQSAE